MAEQTTKPDRGAPRWLELLRSQGLGLICGQLTVLLLAVGSIVIAATRDGASRNLQLDDVRPFFEEPALAHLWFYLLLPVLGLYGLNTALCTLHALTQRIRRRITTLRLYAPSLFHIGFGLTLIAHLASGLWAKEGKPIYLGMTYRPLGEGRAARVKSIGITQQPNGQLEQVYAKVEVRDSDGDVTQHTVRYNGPITYRLGARLHLLVTYGAKRAAQLTIAGKTCRALPGDVCRGAATVRVLALHERGHWGPDPAARVEIQQPAGRSDVRFLRPGRPYRLPGGATIALAGIVRGGWILLRARDSPGVPWALVAAIFLLLGTVLMGRRWV